MDIQKLIQEHEEHERLKREEYLKSHSKEEIFNKVLAYREIIQDLQDRVAELEKQFPDEIEREGIHVKQLFSKCAFRELIGFYANHPQKILEYPLDKQDITEGFHKKVYFAMESLAEMGYEEIDGAEVVWYLKDQKKIRANSEDDMMLYVNNCKRFYCNLNYVF